jgi:hypothetical protein
MFKRWNNPIPKPPKMDRTVKPGSLEWYNAKVEFWSQMERFWNEMERFWIKHAKIQKELTWISTAIILIFMFVMLFFVY